jgi:threonine dehydrogenase-like Zn-dependent dehydrogenase
MRAVRVHDGHVAVDDVPAVDGPGVRVYVRSAGICGSDLHLIEAGVVEAAQVTLGHEVAGVTDDGTPVAIEPLAPCGACGPCLDGDYNLCRTSGAMLFGIGRDGGMADEMWVPERALVPLPAGIDVRDASLVEPLAVVVHSFRRSVVPPFAPTSASRSSAAARSGCARWRSVVRSGARWASPHGTTISERRGSASARRRSPASTT